MKIKKHYSINYSLLFLCSFLLLFSGCNHRVEFVELDETMGSISNARLSDYVYCHPYIFTCTIPEEYEIIEKGNGIISIEGNRYDDRTYHRRYHITVSEPIHMQEEKQEFLIDDFYKDAYYEVEDRTARLKKGSLYLVFVYGTEGSYHIDFDDGAIELDRNGNFVHPSDAWPWKSLDEVKATFREELQGLAQLTMEDVAPCIHALVKEYGSKYEYDLLNYKIYSKGYCKSTSEFAEASVVGDYWQVVGYWKDLEGKTVITPPLTLAKASDGSPVLAEYHGHEMSRAMVDYQQKLAGGRSEREIVDTILRGYMMVEEAEARGLAATQEEIDEMVEAPRRAYESGEMGENNALDEYCAGLGITIEEYFAQLREQAPENLAHAKLRDTLAREYCEAHGLEYRPGAQPDEVNAAVEAELDKLFEEHKGEIVYY